ncbi:MAG: hypothetical protein JJU02_14735 [Cryomorphaceae bacterium]|nr:hypothetical protein [Cryomorphaceae bacterium]
MKIRNLFSMLAMSAILSTACSSDDESGGTPANGELTGVFVANEGPFNSGNGSLTHYDPDDETISQDVFVGVNGTPIGNIFQSISRTENAFVLVANNSGLVRIADNNMELQQTIDDLSSPRYAVEAGAGVVAISDWSTNEVHLYNSDTWTSMGAVACENGPDQMLFNNLLGELWVLNSGGFSSDSTITIVNAATRSVQNTLTAAGNPNSIVRDATNDIWVLCGGIKDWNDPANDKAGALIQYDNQGNEKNRFVFPNPSDSPGKLVINAQGTTLYWLENGYGGAVYSMNVSASELPVSALISGNYYALGIDPKYGNIFCGDAADFSSAGSVTVYGSNGGKIFDFPAGIIPGGFLFHF